MVLLLSSLPVVTLANSFLEAGKGPDAEVVSLQARSEELQAALGAVQGCTGDGAPTGDQRSTAAIREGLLPVWNSLPKNKQGRVEWKLVRYVAHRHFMQHFNVLVRGLEPNIRLSEEQAGEAEVLSRQAPALAKQLASNADGFSLEDAAVMIAALEQLLFDSDSELLELLYKKKKFKPHQVLNKQQLQDVLMDYMVYWMVGDPETAELLVADQRSLKDTIPHWSAIQDVVAGAATALAYNSKTGRLAFDGLYSFEEALQVAGSIGRSFGSFWEAQCEDTKASLVRFDTTGTGRVRLPDFYAANKEGEWRFGESEAYLRELGALDETASWRGKQVIVSNYMQAASNCVVTRPHYLVCCMNECEWILAQIEEAVGAPLATVEQVLEVVVNMTDGEDEPARVDDQMVATLRRVARTHGGRLPLHGRLFAQWLHYAFPQECAFPHKAGEAAARTPSQFGDASIVTAEEVSMRVAMDVIEQDISGANDTAQGRHAMTQWSEDEELLGDYSQHAGLLGAWDAKTLALFGGVGAALALAVAAGSSKGSGAPKTHSV